MLTFDTTHEYYLGENACLHYCSDHGTLIVTPDHENRVLLSGIKKETMLDFARKLVQEDLDKTLAKYEDKDATVESILDNADKSIDDYARNGAFASD